MEDTRPGSMRSYRRCRNNTFSSSRSNFQTGSQFDDSTDSIGTAPSSLPNSPPPSLKSDHSRRTLEPIIVDVEPPRAIELHAPDTTRRLQESQGFQYFEAEVLDDYVIHDEPDEWEDDVEFIFEKPFTRRQHRHVTILRPTVPSDFAEYFPSHRRLLIHHDDSSPDSEMNLRLDVEEMLDDTKVQLQLFHLRMKDLASRTFSLRRYCRDSGREVCNSVRRTDLSTNAHPIVQRSLRNAFAALITQPIHDHHLKSVESSAATTRAENGFEIDDVGNDMFCIDDGESITSKSTDLTSLRIPAKYIKLEFSNYAQVHLKRSGSNSARYYAFEYWGIKYNWKRSVQTTQTGTAIRFHLMRAGRGKALAHILPVKLSPEQIDIEARLNSWIPPSELWISDTASLTAFTDVADVIVATGLMALVDDIIERQSCPPSSPKARFTLPTVVRKAVTSSKMRTGIDCVLSATKRLARP